MCSWQANLPDPLKFKDPQSASLDAGESRVQYIEQFPDGVLRFLTARLDSRQVPLLATLHVDVVQLRAAQFPRYRRSMDAALLSSATGYRIR